jgi:Cu(I)/Ag(I) efflux system membrane protein CusA/SilA
LLLAGALVLAIGLPKSAMVTIANVFAPAGVEAGPPPNALTRFQSNYPRLARALSGMGSEFMPPLNEGSLLFMPVLLPSTSLTEVKRIMSWQDKVISQVPEVAAAAGKLGRAETATDPAPVEMIETTVMLKPQSEWRAGMTKEKLVAEMNDAMQIVGYVNSWSQPISTRVIMQDSGIQTPVGIKIKGTDIGVVEEVAQNVETLLRDFPGTQAVIAERIARGYFMDAQLDLERMGARGVTVDEAMTTVRFAIGGDNVVGIREADKTVVPLAIQYTPEYIDTVEKVRNTPVVTEDGRSVALGEVADVSVREAPEMIRNDNETCRGRGGRGARKFPQILSPYVEWIYCQTRCYLPLRVPRY